MSGYLKDKVAVVTGGTGYLGSVITKRFAAGGAKVYVPIRSLEKFKTVFDAREEVNDFPGLLKIYGLLCDAFVEDEVKRFCDDVFKMEGRIDILINTIGGYHKNTLIQNMTMDLIDSQKKLNFDTTFYFSKHVLTYMKINKFGRVISISAKAAIQPAAGKFAYSFSKQGVINLMNILAEENKDNFITFNSIVPEIIDTPANRQSMPEGNFERWVKCDELASLCIYLSSDNAGKINGNVFKFFVR